MTPTVTRLPIPATVGAHPREPSMAVIVPTYGRPGALGKCLWRPPLSDDSKAAGRPAITVVLPTWDSFDALRTTIAHLARQTIADHIELLICASGANALTVDAAAVAPLHSTRVVEAGDVSARARAIRAARADVVAFTEDHCYPDPRWAEALLHAQRRAARGRRARHPQRRPGDRRQLGRPAPRLRPLARARTARHHEPAAGSHVSYNRSVLLEYDDLDVLMEAETVLLRDLRRRGHTLLFEPAATTAHTNFSRFRVLLDVQWHLGRVFAATRAARWSTPRRLAYAAASPAIPLIRLSHVLRYGRRNRVPAATIARAAPALAAALAVDCAAQAAGALLGGGRSVARLAACEFHRAEVNRTGRPPADKAAPPAGGGTVPASRSSG